MVLREVLSGGALLARGAKPVFRARGRREKAFREIKEGDYIKYIVTDCELLSRTNRISRCAITFRHALLICIFMGLNVCVGVCSVPRMADGVCLY